MSVKASSLREWLETLPDDADVFIDDGGLTLRVDGYKAYYEIGGQSVADPSDPVMHCGERDCPICKAFGLTLPADGDDEPPGEVVFVAKESP